MCVRVCARVCACACAHECVCISLRVCAALWASSLVIAEVCVRVRACLLACVREYLSQVHNLQEKAGSSHVVLAAGGGMIQTTSQLLRK